LEIELSKRVERGRVSDGKKSSEVQSKNKIETCAEGESQKDDGEKALRKEAGRSFPDGFIGGGRRRERDPLPFKEEALARSLGSIGVCDLDRGQGKTQADLSSIDGARCFRVGGDLFGRGFDQLGAEMPHEWTPADAEQVHKSVGNEDETAQFQGALSKEFLVHKA